MQWCGLAQGIGRSRMANQNGLKSPLTNSSWAAKKGMMARNRSTNSIWMRLRDEYDRMRCNGRDLGLGSTTPVGIFPNGASPYEVLDLSGNVWKWTRSIWGEWDDGDFKSEFKRPYVGGDSREDLKKGDDWARVVRGGAFWNNKSGVRCSARVRLYPYYRGDFIGFRIVASPFFTSGTLIRRRSRPLNSEGVWGILPPPREARIADFSHMVEFIVVTIA